MLTIYHFVIFYIHSDDGKDLWNAIDNAIQCDEQYQYKIGREDFIIKHLEMSKIFVSELSEESYCIALSIAFHKSFPSSE